jgi:hypothetical protein
MWSIKCPWCGEGIDVVMDSCGTGTTWSLFKCLACNKLAASGDIPDAVKNDEDVKIVRIFGYRDNCALGYIAGVFVTNDNICIGRLAGRSVREKDTIFISAIRLV